MFSIHIVAKLSSVNCNHRAGARSRRQVWPGPCGHLAMEKPAASWVRNVLHPSWSISISTNKPSFFSLPPREQKTMLSKYYHWWLFRFCMEKTQVNTLETTISRLSGLANFHILGGASQERGCLEIIWPNMCRKALMKAQDPPKGKASEQHLKNCSQWHSSLPLMLTSLLLSNWGK